MDKRRLFVLDKFVIKPGIFYFYEIDEEKANELKEIANEKGILIECRDEEAEHIEYNINDGILIQVKGKFYFGKYAGEI